MELEVTHPPHSTYRVQLHAGFGFDAVGAIADYVHALGISHLYSSPYLQAARGSTHGYDVVDPRQVNAELGGAEAHARMCAKLGENDLGQVLDVVPNHMSIADRSNRWWWDVLENGQSSRYAAFFDVEWQPPELKLHNMVSLPILGDHFGRVVEAGQIQLARNKGTFTFHYYDNVLPVAPRSLDNLLASAAERSQSPQLSFIADSFGRLPLSTATDRTSIARRHRDKEVLRELLAELCEKQPAVAAAIDEIVAAINVEPDAIASLLDRQNYRLAFWRTAGRELDYRRFFDINTLVSLRMEDDRVFAETHALVLGWLKDGVLDGLRIDHPDGLRDPEEYFRRLHEAAPQAWIVGEKILEPGEKMPATWPIAGTTGYDFLNRLSGVYVDRDGEGPLTELYGQFTGEETSYETVIHEKKLLALQQMFGSDVNRLTALLVDVCELHRRYRDYTRHELHEVLREVIACFPVYRTYVRPYIGQVSDDDVNYTTQAVEAAKQNRPDLDADLFGFVRDLLLLRTRGDLESEFVARFQQLTGPVMAKGVEDTAFYCYNRLISLNEVGGDPGHFGYSLEEFHQACEETQELWPLSMLASSTHDTKRSEDVRARIGLLAEIPEQWGRAVKRWAKMNGRHWHEMQPDRNMEYLLYQTLVGAWPLPVERATAYMLKASREAKVHTSWVNQNEEYEQGMLRFVEAILADAEFQQDLKAFVTPLLEPGRITSLAQTLVKLTAPGVPDVYQGTEIWDLSLVDPDNRRPVNYELRRQLLARLEGATPEMVWAGHEEGLPKMWVIRQALRFRHAHPDLFGREARYRALQTQGPKSNHALAFARGDRIVTVVPRLVIRLNGDWSGTTISIEEGNWHNLMTGDRVSGGVTRFGDLLGRFPVALLVRE